MKTRTTWMMTPALLAVALSVAWAGNVMLMDADTLKRRLGDDDVVVLDVRTGRDWSASEFMIKGARRVDPRDFDTWSSKLDSNKTIVFYCA